MLLVHSILPSWAKWGEGCLMLDAWEAKNQNFCGILCKALDAAPLAATSVCSIKSSPPKPGIKSALFTSCETKLGAVWCHHQQPSFVLPGFSVPKIPHLKKKKEKRNCWKPLFCCSACFISFCLATSTPAVLTTKNCPFFCPVGIAA